ncbi:uncharacterized protein BP5553_03538 [Venustampulla echinocandica]|uniref:BZIP domain-containing protein n=1 Tax=Venustampulla echinocandica TaxID=2656787 RepID=A0A370TUP7_9HELO|nr:uncharacterized protein BP5553_03538 [Venustampulla echinocandica]RDL39198.1 hypothetical protein BP5553_03538 [Venustampulla echinocandica]
MATEPSQEQAWASLGDLVPTLCDGSSSESSASSPLNCNGAENLYGGPGYMAYPFPVQYGESVAPFGLIPVELKIESLYDDYDRRRRKNGGEKTVSSHVHSVGGPTGSRGSSMLMFSRDAELRIERAFRDRKEKHTRDLEQRIVELECRHKDLSQSYELLHAEYKKVKEELDKSSNPKPEDLSRNFEDQNSGELQGGVLDPLLFDMSAFYIAPDERQHVGA